MIARAVMVMRIAVVLLVALAAGHVVQSLRPVSTSPIIVAADGVPSAATGLPELGVITTVSATSSDSNPACDLKLDLASLPGAMISVSLSAPCNVGERVVIRHSGLAFAESIDAAGQLRAQFPALSQEASVAVYVGSSNAVLGTVSVPDVQNYLRLAVQIPGAGRFDLRAEELGQVFVAKTMQDYSAGQRLTILGQTKLDNPMLSQVYSVALADYSKPKLTVELRITPEICGQTLTAEVVLSEFGKTSVTSPSISVPTCGTSGDILLLKNLLPDLTLANLE